MAKYWSLVTLLLLLPVAIVYAGITGINFHNGIDKAYVAVVTLDNGNRDSVDIAVGGGVTSYNAPVGRAIASVVIFGTQVPLTAAGCSYPISDHVYHAGWFLATNTTVGDFWTCMN